MKWLSLDVVNIIIFIFLKDDFFLLKSQICLFCKKITKLNNMKWVQENEHATILIVSPKDTFAF
jgi:hypothetical protein